jgi:ATP-dependent helicase/nuclease subunit A
MMSNTPSLKRKVTKKLCSDQENALGAYFLTGQVCVDAGAGTGKTMTLVEIASKTVITQPQPGNTNPFKRLLIVTFGVEASRELKSRIRKRLLDHQAAGGSLDPDTFRYLESQSNIMTIDALILSLISEVSIDLGMSLTSEIADQMTQSDLIQSIIKEVRTDPKLDDCWTRLDTLYPTWRRRFSPESVRDLVWITYQKIREFCWTPDDVERQLLQGLSMMHAGCTPPFTKNDLVSIVDNTRGTNANLNIRNMTESEALAAIEDVYNSTHSAIEDLVQLIRRFDELYDTRTTREGVFTYTDLSYIIWRYLQTPKGKEWKEDLAQRYDHLLVDEFQDTNFVQNEILKVFIRDDGSNDFTRVLFIGDVKQSIYQWRSADPGIFLEMINSLSQNQPLLPPLSRMVRTPLKTNFRSHQSLLEFINCLFSHLFEDRLRGAIFEPVPYVELDPFTTQPLSSGQTRIHVLHNDGETSDAWVTYEANRVAELIAGGLAGLPGVKEKDSYDPSDVALLFRRRGKIPAFVQALRDRGLKCAILADISLFEELEISLVIDVLDWLSNPDSKDSLLRILRSPLSALSDKALRYLVNEKFYLSTALDNWPTGILSDNDRQRLKQLAKLRDDIRWDREGPKADLISKVIAHSFLDTVVTASANGLQAHANLWLLVEFTRTWEEEDILRYDDFVSRLKAIRADAEGQLGREYRRAILADEKSKDSIKIMTVHAAKGLEFPIVFLCDNIVQTGTMVDNDRMVRSRKGGMWLKPVPSSGVGRVQDIVANAYNNRRLDWVAPYSESLLWVSSSRNPQGGNLVCNAHWQGALLEEQAEFWRLLYVALTRTKDHLFFSVGNNYRTSFANRDEYPYTSWMPYLREFVELGQLLPGQVTSVKKDICGTSKTFDIPIGLDEIVPSAPKPLIKPQYSLTMGSKIASAIFAIPEFIPSSINASTCGILVECPRRYQYELLWEVSRVRERDQRSKRGISSGIPYGIAPDVWGNAIHFLMEHRNFTTTTDKDNLVLDLLDPTSDFGKQYVKQLLEMKQAVENFDNTPLYTELQALASRGIKLHREFKVHALLQHSGYPDIPVNGFIDLLLEETPGSWLAIDFKAEPRPPQNSYQERIHRMQLVAYSWLLKEHYNRDVTRCVVAYLYPTPTLIEFVPDPKDFHTQVTSAIQYLTINPKRGLTAKPDQSPTGPCYMCAFANSVGGPCEYG